MIAAEIPVAIRNDTALLFLYRRVEDALGIRATAESLVRLKNYLEERCGASYENLLEDREELLALAPLVTVNETYFFREEIHFRLLSRYFLPLLARHKRPIRLCSAATSVGCEAYSIAMVTDFYSRGRLQGGHVPLSWELDAFDVNGEVIEAAGTGRYTANALREDGSEWQFLMDLYLQKGDRDFEVIKVLRDKVRFFTHNIMEGLSGFYDLIFFRNALIYFSPENRRKILDILINALADGGALIVGVSETSSVDDPRLEFVHRMGAFYFEKRGSGAVESPAVETLRPAVRPQVAEVVVPPVVPLVAAVSQPAPVVPSVAAPPQRMPRKPIDAAEIARILEQGEGGPNAERILAILRAEPGIAEPEIPALAAAALSLVNRGDLNSAALVLARLEAQGSSPETAFLRGEFYYHQAVSGNAGEAGLAAEEKYQEAMVGDGGFWPAYYRVSSLAEDGNRTRYEYRLKKTLESMEKGDGRGYEIFIGGFSPDYYRRILERKLAE
jgi:chemotaxis protein methyltransferase CheR